MAKQGINKAKTKKVLLVNQIFYDFTVSNCITVFLRLK